MAADKATLRWIVDKFLDHGPSLIASTAAVLGPLWARYKDELKSLNVEQLALYTLPVLFVIFLLHALLRLIISARQANEARASYENSLAKTSSTVNPLENEFAKKIIRLSDLFISFRPVHPHKRFIDCEITGPGVVTLTNMNTLEGCGFYECNIICVPSNQYVTGIIAFSSSSFVNTNFRFVTILVDEAQAANMKKNMPNATIINYPIVQSSLFQNRAS